MSTPQPLPGDPESSAGEGIRGWWQQHGALSGDLKAALAVNIRDNLDGTQRTDVLPVARLRGGVTISPSPWVDATARLATFIDKDVQGVSFRLKHRRDLQPGVLTFDSLFLTLKPHELFTMKIGRLQTEGPPFELDSVVLDTLSRHDSSGLDVSWTDGVYMIVGRPSSFQLHLIGQLNPKEGPTNGVGARGPLDFEEGASRVTYYVGLEAPPPAPFTQLVADVTIIPQALRPLGLGTQQKEDVVAFTIRSAADFPLQQGRTPLTLHPFVEFGAMVSTPVESALGISTAKERADRFAFVTGFDLRHLGPGSLGIQFAWAQAGYLISPDYPNNSWSIEARYRLDIARNAFLDLRYQHRQEIDRQVDAVARQADDNFQAEMTISF